MHHFVAKRLIHLIRYVIIYHLSKPIILNWCSLLFKIKKTKLGNQLHFYKGLKLRFSDFFTEKENSVIIYSVIPQATAVWQMLLYKWNFSWLMLSCRTREEKCKNSTSSRNFHSLHKTTGGESLTKTATYLNYCRMLCTYSIEHIALFQVGTSLKICEHQTTKYILNAGYFRILFTYMDT